MYCISRLPFALTKDLQANALYASFLDHMQEDRNTGDLSLAESAEDGTGQNKSKGNEHRIFTFHGLILHHHS